MTDTKTQLTSSIEAQDRVREILDAANTMLTQGNRLYTDLHDEQAFFEILLAIAKGTTAASAFFKVTIEPYVKVDNE